MTPQERAAERRKQTRALEAKNHAAGLHVTFVETCEACIRERNEPRHDR